MTTGHLLIVCVGALIALFIVARTVVVIAAERAKHDRLLAQRQVDAAAPARELADATRRLAEVADALAPAPSAVGERVTIHTRQPDDRVITGVIEHEHPDQVVLVGAEYVTAQGAVPVPGGRASVPRANEAYRQLHGKASAE